MVSHDKIQEKIRERLFVARLNAKDSEIFVEVYNHYVDRIYRYIYFKTSVHEDAEDLASDVFLKAWQYIFQSGKTIEYLNAFLFQIARNSVIDYYRKRSKVEMVNDEEVLENIDNFHQENLLKAIDTRAEILAIEMHLKKIRNEYREILVLKYIEELSTVEIGKILNKSKGAVRILVHRAMKELKAQIEKKT